MSKGKEWRRMLIICIFFGSLFCMAGILFACGQGHIHLSAWKAMPEEEKRKIKILPLCQNIGGMIALNGMIFLVKGLWAGFSECWFTCVMTVWLIIAGFDVWYIGKSDRYRDQRSASAVDIDIIQTGGEENGR